MVVRTKHTKQSEFIEDEPNLTQYNMNIEATLATIPKVTTKRGRKNAHSPGHSRFVPQMHQLLDEKYMSRTQREAHRTGIEIWV